MQSLNLEKAKELLNKHIKGGSTLKHSRETEVIMRALAKHFGEDEDLWGITGLLHDLDWEEIGNKHELHGKRTVEILKKEGLDSKEMLKAILSHCESMDHVDEKRESKMDYCLSAAENITGIISAYVLVRPDKKIAEAKVKSINKKLKDKAFAANVSRELIYDIEKTGLQKNEFIQIALDAIKQIAAELGF